MLQEKIVSIRKGERLLDALKRRGYKGLPSNCVINKTLPGLGVTHCELMSDRDSIIVEPNVPAIKGKLEKYRHALGAYSGVSPHVIADYLSAPSDCRKKILITPNDFFTIKEIMRELNINMFEDFFLFLDECEKDFPIENLKEDFFLFRNRSFVTSTSFITNDPMLEKQGFYILTLCPEYEYKQKLRLITTNNIVETLTAQLSALKGPVCIFSHSVETLDSLVSDIPLLQEEGHVFREEEVFPSLQGKRYLPGVPAELKRFSLFDSDYYLAVDMEMPSPPHLILVSGLFGNQPSFIDPKTEAVQIAGRFRRGVESMTHISNINPELSFYTPKQARAWLKNAGKVYNGWVRKMATTHHEGARELLQEAVSQSRYARFVDESGNLSLIRVAKFIEQETVKGLYTQAKLLEEAYERTNCFTVSHTREVHIFSDKDRLSLQRKLTQEGRNRLLLTRFEQLEVLRKLHSSKAQTRYRHLINQLINNPSDDFLYNCFLEYGSNFIRNSGFKEHIMRKALNRNA
ncbi:MAG: hypothetical protein LBS88_11205 [Tannerellaceae bacterium]|jgi:hypothetical protein|nr:hypothetical protein [Tannerellaceae bacterium]